MTVEQSFRDFLNKMYSEQVVCLENVYFIIACYKKSTFLQSVFYAYSVLQDHRSLKVTINKSHFESQLLIYQFSIKIFKSIFKNIFKSIFKSCIFKSSHRRSSPRKGVLRNFEKFTGKHLRQSLFFNKVADQACNFIKKETLAQVFSGYLVDVVDLIDDNRY